MDKLREDEMLRDRKNRARTVARAAKEAKVPMVVKV
jgi:hypothetical protein